LTQQHFCHHKHVVEVHGFRRLSEGCWGSNMDPWNLSIITKIHSFEFLFMSFWEIGPRLIWISKRKQSQINTFRKILPTAVYYCL
jgi:hypothetical protein